MSEEKLAIILRVLDDLDNIRDDIHGIKSESDNEMALECNLAIYRLADLRVQVNEIETLLKAKENDN